MPPTLHRHQPNLSHAVRIAPQSAGPQIFHATLVEPAPRDTIRLNMPPPHRPRPVPNVAFRVGAQSPGPQVLNATLVEPPRSVSTPRLQVGPVIPPAINTGHHPSPLITLVDDEKTPVPHAPRTHPMLDATHYKKHRSTMVERRVAHREGGGKVKPYARRAPKPARESPLFESVRHTLAAHAMAPPIIPQLERREVKLLTYDVPVPAAGVEEVVVPRAASPPLPRKREAPSPLDTDHRKYYKFDMTERKREASTPLGPEHAKFHKIDPDQLKHARKASAVRKANAARQKAKRTAKRRSTAGKEHPDAYNIPEPVSPDGPDETLNHAKRSRGHLQSRSRKRRAVNPAKK